MKRNFKDLLFSSRVGQIGGVILSVYSFFWAILEPLSLPWISTHQATFRTILIVVSLLVAIILLVPLTSQYLAKFEAGSLDNNLRDSCVSTGSPILKETVDGRMGLVVDVAGHFRDAPMDWYLPNNAQNAGKLVFVYKYNKVPFHFYVRVIVISSDGTASLAKWIRFDHDVVMADRYSRQEEMACPYESQIKSGYQTTVIDLEKAVKETFGQGGWSYQRVMIFRVRGEGTIKLIGLKR